VTIITEEQKKWFLEGLIQAATLLCRTTNRIDWDKAVATLREEKEEEIK